MSVSEIAREMNMTPQNITAKFGRKTVKRDFIDKLNAIIDKCCPPLPAEMEKAVMGQSITGNNNTGNINTVSSSNEAALLKEIEMLREQNDYLRKQNDRLLAILEK